MVRFNMRKLLKFTGVSILTVLICNLVFSLIYGFSFVIPRENVIHSLQKSHESAVLKTPPNSIERSTTGWGIDYGTECVALSVGLKDKQKFEGLNKFKSRFYDSYLVSGHNKGVFDPCAGLLELINPTESSTQNSDLISYARNWWGMSILVQLLIWLVGLATTKTLLYGSMVLSLGYFYHKFSQASRDYKVGLILLFPLILFGDFQEMHNSFPYSLFFIELFLIAVVTINLVNLKKYSMMKFLIFAIAAGSIYNFVFWFDFHLVLVFVPSVIFLLHYRLTSFSSIFQKIFIFIYGFGFGFVVSTLIKWIISVGFYGNEILITIKDALSLRLGSESQGINGPLSEYSSNFSGLPLSLRAIVVNLMVAASKFIDPRNSSFIGIILFVSLYLFLTSLFIKNTKPFKNIKLIEFFYGLVIASIPFIYYFLTPNHSFNHAAVSYRAIPIILGFSLSFIYISKTRPRSLINF